MALAQRANIQEGECLLALEELHRGDLPCGLVRVMVASVACSINLPLMILQKMHEAAMFVGGMMCSFDALLPLVRTLQSHACLLAAALHRPTPRRLKARAGWLALGCSSPCPSFFFLVDGWLACTPVSSFPDIDFAMRRKMHMQP